MKTGRKLGFNRCWATHEQNLETDATFGGARQRKNHLIRKKDETRTLCNLMVTSPFYLGSSDNGVCGTCMLHARRIKEQTK